MAVLHPIQASVTLGTLGPNSLGTICSMHQFIQIGLVDRPNRQSAVSLQVFVAIVASTTHSGWFLDRKYL